MTTIYKNTLPSTIFFKSITIVIMNRFGTPYIYKSSVVRFPTFLKYLVDEQILASLAMTFKSHCIYWFFKL